METFEVKPFVGIGPIKLGSTREEIEQILGDPDTCLDREGVIQLFYKGFCIHLNAKGKAEFIAASFDKNYAVTFLGMDLLREKALVLIENISKTYEYDDNDFELGYSYIYQDIQLGFYRPTMPENEEDTEGKYFQVASVAEQGYWNEI
ncbi:hypothetical protein [Colwellia sp. E150_009]